MAGFNLASANGGLRSTHAAAGVHLGTISPHNGVSDWPGANEQLQQRTEVLCFVNSAVTQLLVADRVGLAAHTVERERCKRRRQRVAAQRRRWQRSVLGTMLWPIVSFFGWGVGE